MSTTLPPSRPDDYPDLNSNWSDHLAFCGDGQFPDGFLGMGNQFGDQPDLLPPADGADCNLLHDVSPTSPSVCLQPCLGMTTSTGWSALTQGLREWNNATFDSTASPTMDLLQDDLIASCNTIYAEPFNPLLLAGTGSTTPIDANSSEFSSTNSSIGSIPIPRRPGQQTFSEYSSYSEPSLAFTGSSFNSDRDFEMLYAAHKQNQHLAPPQQNASSGPVQSHVSSWQPQSLQFRPSHVQRGRRLAVDQPKRLTSSSLGSNAAKNSLSFIHFRPGREPGQLYTHGSEYPLNGKKPRGRKNPLTPAQKKGAALMRRVKACESCRQRKEKCDPGIPCKACIEHFRTDLIRQPCRGKALEDLTSSMLSGGSTGSSSSSECAVEGTAVKARDSGTLYELGWCPMERTLDAYFGPGAYKLSSEVSFVSLMLGFGPSLLQEVRVVIPDRSSQLFHKHIVYGWPAGANETILASHPRQDYHRVLPAILSDMSSLRHELDGHLSNLVNEEQYFRQFPLFNSPLEVLKHIYIFFRDITDTTQRHILRTALKLLVLVHIGDNMKLDPSVPLFSTFSRDGGDVRTMTPCFIRGQLGAVIPSLAQSLLRESLSRLEGICLARRCADWPVAIATMATLCMAVESVQYHAAKVPYHANFGATTPDNSSDVTVLTTASNPQLGVFGSQRPSHSICSAPPSSSPRIPKDVDDDKPASSLSIDNEESVDRIISFYRICFRGCHCTRLQEPDLASVSRKRRRQPGDQDAASASFITSLKTSLLGARAYLAQRKSMDGYALKMMGMKCATEIRKEARGTSATAGSVGQQRGNGRDMSVFFDRLLAKLFLD